MASYKVYQSGNNLEIYEFEHMQTEDGVEALKEYNQLKDEYEYLKIAFKNYVATIDRLQKKAIDYYERTGVIYSDVISKVRKDNYDMVVRYGELTRYFEGREEKKELSVSEKDALKVKRRYQTLRDNANNLKRMIRAYFSYKAFMVTLTYSDKYACTAEQIDKSDRRVRAMWEKLRKVYGPDIQFAGVRELQKKRGVIHYHYIVESSVFYDSYKESGAAINKRKNDAHKMFENQFEKDFWKFGFVDIRNVVGIDDTGAYLAKYMTKAKIKEMEWLENRRLILRSENIKKIEPVGDSIVSLVAENIEDIKIIAQMNIIDNRERKSIFSNGYESQYTGQVYYFELHLERLTDKEKNSLQKLLDSLE